MIKNYFKIAFRNIWKNKGYAAINIIGLSVAFCISIFLLMSVYFQLSFDNFHEDGERIFQTYLFYNEPGKPERTGSMPTPLTPALKAEYGEIEAATRYRNNSSLITYEGKYFDKQVQFVDADFFRVFSFPLIQGNRNSALNGLSDIVISRNMAKAIFGDEEPVGKQLLLGAGNNQKAYLVNGVLEDFPENSTLRFDALIRIENHENYYREKDQWDAMSHRAFIKLKPGVGQVAFENRLKSFNARYFAENISKLQKKGAKPDSRGDIFAVRLQKLENLHFDKDISGGSSSSIAVVYAILGIAFFILLIACINFINLTVARSFTRAREVGVRKSLGALKNQLFVQIWGEATMICFGGFAVGILLAYLLLPYFNATFNGKLSMAYIFQPDRFAIIFTLFLLVTLIAGGYPAWQMSKFNAVEVLKGKINLARPGILRNSLIVTQFTLSSLLICCTIIAIQQVDHLRDQPLGFTKEQVISIPVGNKVDGQEVLKRMRNLLQGDPAIVSLSGSTVNLGVGKDRSTSRSVIGFTYKDQEIASDWVHIQYDYLKTLGIKLLDGREFDPAFQTDSVNRVIITQSMAKMIGEKDPVGKFFETDTTGSKYQIIGLIPDFNLYSSKSDKKPVTMYLSNREPIGYIFVRVAPANLSGAMDKISKAWKEVAPQAEFTGTFLDENTDSWYKDEEKFSQMFSLASGIAVLLSCLGLFAVALMVIEQRTKEIGVRKVLGASITNIVYTLSQDFVKMVVLSIAIATPLAWYAMQKWLDNYSYRIEISVWIFILVGLAAVFIALVTVSFQSIKAALMNPVKSLKSE